MCYFPQQESLIEFTSWAVECIDVALASLLAHENKETRETTMELCLLVFFVETIHMSNDAV